MKIAQALIYLSSVASTSREMNIDIQNATPAQITDLFTQLSAMVPPLEKLTLTGSPIESFTGALSHYIKVNPSLHDLSVTHANLSTEEISRLAEATKECAVTSLDLSYCDIALDHIGIEQVIAELESTLVFFPEKLPEGNESIKS